MIKDDPSYMIEKILIPLKERFVLEELPVIGRRREIKYYSYSFGAVIVKNGPEIIDELISDLKIL
jgi:hypothetical protein